MGIFVQTTGFQKRTLTDIKTSMIAGFQSLFGPKVDTSDEGPTGEIISMISSALADAWDGGEEVYASYDPSAATGAALDRVCALTGVIRLTAAATQVDALLYTDSGNIGCVIPSGRQARRVRGALVFSLSADVTIAASSCQDIYLKLAGTPVAGTPLSVSLTFGEFSATIPTETSTDAMALAALTALASSINASSWATSSGGAAQVVKAGSVVYPTVDTVGAVQLGLDSGYYLRIVHPSVAFGATSYAGLALGLCGSVGSFYCNSTGANTVVKGELSEIVTPETGWDAVGNLVAGITGRSVETDEELRLRRAASLGSGLATETSITNYIYNHVAGVSSVSVVSNRTMETDSMGRPPKSFEVTVEGGQPQAIGNAIWHAMPAGIQSYGATPVTVTDSEGGTQTVCYTRPTALRIYVRVLYTLDSEANFPSDGAALIRASVLAWVAANGTVGADVYAGKMLGSVYSACAGLGLVTIQLSLDNFSTTSDHLVVDGGYYAALSDSDLIVALGTP